MKQTSLQKQLLLWIMAILLCVGTLASGFSFFKTYHDLNALQRSNLKNIAMLFASAPPRRPKDTLHEQEVKAISLATDTEAQSGKPSHKPDFKPDLVQVFDEVMLNSNSSRPPADKLSPNKNVTISSTSGDKPENAQQADSTTQEGQADNTSDMSQYDSKTDGEIRVSVIPLPLDRLSAKHLERIKSQHLFDLPVGFGEMEYKGEDWQSYRMDQETRIIIVRQKASLQEKLALEGGLQAFLPVLLSMLVLMGLLPFVLNKMFKPVRQLSRQVANRDEQDLSAIDIAKDGTQVQVPAEIEPLVTETNQLLGRMSKHIKQQQRFVADSAHELRSPLTAISLQVQRLQRLAKPTDLTAEQSANVREGIDKLAVRVSHNQHLVEQLLTLARIDAQQLQLSKTDLMPVLTQAVMLLLPIADNKQIELAVDNQLEGTHKQILSEQINIDETSLMMVLKNLLQNAILYTANGGQVRVAITDTQALLANKQFDEKQIEQKQIEHKQPDELVGITTDKTIAELVGNDHRLVVQICDTGVGIAKASYKNAFSPFVRINDGADKGRSDTASAKGTGLGLAIVQQICEQTGIEIYLSATNKNNEKNKGLTVTLVFG